MKTARAACTEGRARTLLFTRSPTDPRKKGETKKREHVPGNVLF